MEVTIKQTVNIPVSPWCGSCYRRGTDKNGKIFCGVFNRFLCMRRGKFLKCRECYMSLYDEIAKGD